MFKLLLLEDIVRIPPDKFGEPINKAGHDQLRMKYEGMVDDELGYVVAVTDINVNPKGKIIPGDGATYHKVSFSILTFYPKIQEVIEGEVVEIADFGAFVRVGPIDALLHVSQLMDDFISYDEKQGVLMGKETRRRLSSGDRVRARVTAVSLARGGGSGKIGMTARQPFLGKIEWVKEEVKKIEAETEQVKTTQESKGEKKSND